MRHFPQDHPGPKKRTFKAVKTFFFPCPSPSVTDKLYWGSQKREYGSAAWGGASICRGSDDIWMKGIGMTDIFKKLMLRVAEFMEIILAIYLVVVLILVIGRTIVVETPMIFTEMTSIHHFLELSLTLAVAIEFVKMLCMHTPGTLIEVLLFAIARHMIVESPTPFQNLVIVLSIVALFAARKYLLTAHDQRGMNEHAHGTHHILKDLMKLREERKELKETVETARERKRLDKVGAKLEKKEPEPAQAQDQE